MIRPSVQRLVLCMWSVYELVTHTLYTVSTGTRGPPHPTMTWNEGRCAHGPLPRPSQLSEDLGTSGVRCAES